MIKKLLVKWSKNIVIVCLIVALIVCITGYINLLNDFYSVVDSFYSLKNSNDRMHEIFNQCAQELEECRDNCGYRTIMQPTPDMFD